MLFCRLKNLPYSFTKLNQMTAMWLSENQVSSHILCINHKCMGFTKGVTEFRAVRRIRVSHKVPLSSEPSDGHVFYRDCKAAGLRDSGCKLIQLEQVAHRKTHSKFSKPLPGHLI